MHLVDEVWTHRCGTEDDEARQSVVAGGTVVVSTMPTGLYLETQSTLTSLEAATGAVRWQQECPHLGPSQSMAADDALLVVLHNGGARPEARGYDLATGSQRWKRTLSGYPRAVTLLGRHVLVAAGSTVWRLDRDGGVVAKRAVRGAQPGFLVTTPDGDVVTSTAKGVVRLSGVTLDVVWDVRVAGEGGEYPRPPVVTHDAVYLHSYSHRAVALDLASGEVRWRKNKEGWSAGVVLAGPEDSLLWGTDALARVRTKDGKQLWQRPHVLAAALVGDGRVVVARHADVDAYYEPDVQIDVRLELLDAITGDVVDATDLHDVRRHWVADDYSDRVFTVAADVLVCGLESGRVRGFRVG